MEKLKEKINKVKQNNKFINFILNGKNITIIVLSFLLFCAFCSYSNPIDITEYKNKIETLNSQIIELNKKLQDTQEQFQNIQNENTSLKSEKE